jgi:hypothetical protein
MQGRYGVWVIQPLPNTMDRGDKVTFEVVVGLATIVSAIVGVLSYRLLHRQDQHEVQQRKPKNKAQSPAHEETPKPVPLTRRVTHSGYGDHRFSRSTAIPVRYASWIIVGNGTVIDTQNHLMWIQGPWGTVYDGSRFVGTPLLFRWHEAADEFGRGLAVCRKDGNWGTLNEENFIESSFEHGYQIGYRKVQFAGFSDWRLPTALEFRTLIKPEADFEEWKSKVFPDVNGVFWCANPKSDVSNFAQMVRRVLKTLGVADPVLENAWQFSLESHSGRYIDEYGGQKYQVIFVRQACDTDYDG